MNTENSIKRYGFDAVLKAEILLGNPNGISRLKQSDIFIQAERSYMLSAFYFHRDDFAFYEITKSTSLVPLSFLQK